MAQIELQLEKKGNVWGLKEKFLLLLIVSVIAVIVGQSFEESVGRLMPEYGTFRSVLNKKQSGLSALLAITQQSGIPCQVWSLPYNRLPETKGLLYVVEPKLAWTEPEVKSILDWVKQGNQLVYLDAFCHYADVNEGKTCRIMRVIEDNILLRKLGILVEVIDNIAPKDSPDAHVDYAPAKAKEKKELHKQIIVYDHQQPEMSHVQKLVIRPVSKLIGGKPIVGGTRGAYITEVNYGAGKILLGTVATLCVNSRLNRPSNYDNFQFMINCFRTAHGAILFDEHCHGLKGTGNVFVYLNNRVPGLVCAQILLILIMAVLGSMMPFGSLIAIQPIRKISDLAYVSGLSNVYKRAQANLAALEIIVSAWKTKLCRWLGVSPRASNDEIMLRAKAVNDTVEQNAGAPSSAWLGKLKDFLADYEQVLTASGMSKARLVYLVKQCDTLEQEMSELKRKVTGKLSK